MRLLPMSMHEFGNKSARKVQASFFRKDLPSRPEGYYRHYAHGLRAQEGSSVIFQYDNQAIATAIYKGRKRYSKPDKDGYCGELFFDTKSIRVFDPLSAVDVASVWKDFPGFSQTKRRLESRQYPTFVQTLKNVKQPQACRST